jgi:hypothetical protein
MVGMLQLKGTLFILIAVFSAIGRLARGAHVLYSSRMIWPHAQLTTVGVRAGLATQLE